MNRETENFLKRVRDAELGAPQDEERVFAAVRSALGTVPSTQAPEACEGPDIDGSSALDVARQGAAATHQTAALGSAGQAAASGWFTKVGASLLFGGALVGSAALVVQSFTDDAETSVVSGHSIENPASRSTATGERPERPIHEDMPLAPPDPLDAPEPLATPEPSRASESSDDGAPLREEQPSGRQAKPRQQEEASRVNDGLAHSEPGTNISARGASVPPPSLAAELALLRRVQAALAAGDGEKALRLLDEHDTSDRQLREERQAARILALCSAGNEQAARTAARHFLRTYPKSVHHQSLKRSCAFP